MLNINKKLKDAFCNEAVHVQAFSGLDFGLVYLMKFAILTLCNSQGKT